MALVAPFTGSHRFRSNTTDPRDNGTWERNLHFWLNLFLSPVGNRWLERHVCVCVVTLIEPRASRRISPDSESSRYWFLRRIVANVLNELSFQFVIESRLYSSSVGLASNRLCSNSILRTKNADTACLCSTDSIIPLSPSNRIFDWIPLPIGTVLPPIVNYVRSRSKILLSTFFIFTFNYI